MSKTSIYIIAGVILVIVAMAGYAWVYYQNLSGQYDAFAKCIADSGAIFYGAFWCPHCHDQKLAFGKSQKYLPYMECSTPDGNGQLQVCKDAKVNAYPTWQFPDGSRQEGELSLKALAAKTGCTIY